MATPAELDRLHTKLQSVAFASTPSISVPASTSRPLAIPIPGGSASSLASPTLLSVPHNGLVAPHGTPISPSLLSPTMMMMGTGSGSNGTGGQSTPTSPMHFDPYPAAPAPTPASSYVDASVLSSSVQRNAAFNASAMLAASSPPVPSMPNAPPNSLVVPAPWPASFGGSVAAASTASGPSMVVLATSPSSGRPLPSLAAGTPSPAPRTRRRSSLSIVSTPYTLNSSSGASSVIASGLASPAPGVIDEEEDDASASVLASGSSSLINGSSGLSGRPRTATADAAAAAALLLGTAGTSVALGAKKDKVYVCDECGKMFKSSGSLAGHRVDHSDKWRAAGKAQLPKHQQIQVLEAASAAAGVRSVVAASTGTTSSESSTLPSSPSADDDIMFPMTEDGPSTVA
ncbi:hypothetical protein BC828DRAFT_371816 [Blastocladiella britannica]|nr:hypothetical protein BC828DRAFT_371816 [Blastocladiella britannica]